MSARVERKKPLHLGCRMNFKLKQKKNYYLGAMHIKEYYLGAMHKKELMQHNHLQHKGLNP